MSLNGWMPIGPRDTRGLRQVIHSGKGVSFAPLVARAVVPGPPRPATSSQPLRGLIRPACRTFARLPRVTNRDDFRALTPRLWQPAIA